MDVFVRTNITWRVVSLTSKPPAETFFTNCSLNFLSFVNIYAARALSPEFITSRLSSSSLTCYTQQKNTEVNISFTSKTERTK